VIYSHLPHRLNLTDFCNEIIGLVFGVLMRVDNFTVKSPFCVAYFD
jgi:hypothetical protein